MTEKYIDRLLTLRQAVMLNIFPLGRRTLWELVKAGQNKKMGEDIEDYVLAHDLRVAGSPRAVWRVTEREIMEWMKRREKMNSKSGLYRPKTK